LPIAYFTVSMGAGSSSTGSLRRSSKVNLVEVKVGSSPSKSGSLSPVRVTHANKENRVDVVQSLPYEGATATKGVPKQRQRRFSTIGSQFGAGGNLAGGGKSRGIGFGHSSKANKPPALITVGESTAGSKAKHKFVPSPKPPALSRAELEKRLEGILLHPTQLAFCSVRDIRRLGLLATSYRDGVEQESVWYSACASFASQHDLYMPAQYAHGWKRLFWDQLRLAKNKWVLPATADPAASSTGGLAAASGGDASAQDFKIAVAVRFKPGGRDGRKGFVLPLHQRLKILKKKQAEMEGGGEGAPGGGGGGGSPKKKAKLGAFDEESQGLGMDAMQSLIEEAGDLPPDVIEALMEAGSLEGIGRQAMLEAKKQNANGKRPTSKWDDDDDDDDAGNAASGGGGNNNEWGAGGQHRAGAGGAAARGSLRAKVAAKTQQHGGGEGEGGAGAKRKLGTSSILAVQQSRVVAYVPGQGVRPFRFNRVFDEDATQKALYETVAQDAVVTALNGINACVLCYGQTGSGKTHTILGPERTLSRALDEYRRGAGGDSFISPHCGVLLRACQEVMNALDGKHVAGRTATDGSGGSGAAAAAAAAAAGGGSGDVSSFAKSAFQAKKEAAAAAAKAGQQYEAGVGSKITLTVQYVEIYQEKVTDLLCERDEAEDAAGQADDDSDSEPSDDDDEEQDPAMTRAERNANYRARAAARAKAKARKAAAEGPGRVELRGGQLVGASEIRVETMGELLQLLQKGEGAKHYAATNMNGRSSRAHTVFVMSLQHTREGGLGGGGEGGKGGQGKGVITRSQLHIVDLAGCEQVKKSGVEGQHLSEAVGINGSLLVLGKCISGLVERRKHVPYLESKLTTLLRSAFGGNSRTTAIITGSMADEHADETVNALCFGERCSMITNSAKFGATSITAAREVVDAALKRTEASLKGLEERGKTGLPAYQKMKDSYQNLQRKRKEMA
jgi:hypothetical protein